MPDSFLAAVLTRVGLLPFLIESCGNCCANGMEQEATATVSISFAQYLISLIDSFLAVLLTRMITLSFVFESCGEYYGDGMDQRVSIYFA